MKGKVVDVFMFGTAFGACLIAGLVSLLESSLFWVGAFTVLCIVLILACNRFAAEDLVEK